MILSISYMHCMLFWFQIKVKGCLWHFNASFSKRRKIPPQKIIINFNWIIRLATEFYFYDEIEKEQDKEINCHILMSYEPNFVSLSRKISIFSFCHTSLNLRQQSLIDYCVHQNKNSFLFN